MIDGTLLIKYKDGKRINSELDLKIIKLFESNKYKFAGSGFLIKEGIRDMQFIRKD